MSIVESKIEECIDARRTRYSARHSDLDVICLRSLTSVSVRYADELTFWFPLVSRTYYAARDKGGAN